MGKRSRGTEPFSQGPFVPPEDWYEPQGNDTTNYRIVVQPPGPGYQHVVTPQEIRDRLAQLPPAMLRPLEVVQLSRMTHKKQTYPCYGMQWGNTLYLYPIEISLTEFFTRPPVPAQLNEVRMYGGIWRETNGGWLLQWRRETIRDFYLNNVLIHELGHLLDDRNSSHADRERFAEWFAIEHGYKPTREQLAHRAAKKFIRKRHHSG